jgi:hypothetical protein
MLDDEESFVNERGDQGFSKKFYEAMSEFLVNHKLV